MPGDRYKIVFRGELADGMSTEDVAANLKKRFKFGDATLVRIFSGRAMILKSDLDHGTAEKYVRALEEAGARSTIEVLKAAAPPPEAVQPALPEPGSPEEVMDCPKCGQSQPESAICIGCGVVVAKFRQRQDEVWAGRGEGSGRRSAEGAGRREVHAVATEDMIQSLDETRPWVRLVSYLLFIGAGLGLLGSIFSMVAMGPAPGGPPGGRVAVFQVLACALYIFPAYFLYKYADSIGGFLQGQKMADLEMALKYQKSFWKFIGILTSVMMAIAVLGIVAAVMIPMLTS